MQDKLAKVVCTIGPASENERTIHEMYLAGMNVARFNFKHGDHKWFEAVIKRIRNVAKKVGEPIAILQDLQGPDIRTGKLKDGQPVELVAEQPFFMTTKVIIGDHNGVSVSLTNLDKHVREGDTVLIDDGSINLMVDRVTKDLMHCVVVKGGPLGQRKGINIPGKRPNIKALHPKDFADIDFGVSQGIEFIAMSFVQSAKDVAALRAYLAKSTNPHALRIKIICKIESMGGIDSLDEIIDAADGIMVARGDMGIEIPLERVPIIQKEIIAKCNALGKPVITATHMLDSMEQNPIPTRAEASDVSNAILDNTDAVMLSGESANGKYPVEAVKTMSRIVKYTEEQIREGSVERRVWDTHNHMDTTEAIAMAAVDLSAGINAKLILTLTVTGRTTRLIAMHRPEVPVVCASMDDLVIRQMMLVNHVMPVYVKVKSKPNFHAMMDEAVTILKQKKILKADDMIVVTVGIHGGNEPGMTNLVIAHKV